MNNLERLDAAIVEAAEKWVQDFEGIEPLTGQGVALRRAVNAKRKALRPKCMVGSCDQVAVQRVIDDAEASEYFRCVQHKIAAVEL